MPAGPYSVLIVFVVVLLALVLGGAVLILAVTRGSRPVAIGTGVVLGALVMGALFLAWVRATGRSASDEAAGAAALGSEEVLGSPDRAAQWKEVRRVAGAWIPPVGAPEADDFLPPDVGEFRLRKSESGAAAPRPGSNSNVVSGSVMIDGFAGIYRSDTESVEVRAFPLDEAAHSALQAALDRREGSGDLPFDDLVWTAGWGFGFRHSEPDRLPAFVERYFHRLPGFPGMRSRGKAGPEGSGSGSGRAELE